MGMGDLGKRWNIISIASSILVFIMMLDAGDGVYEGCQLLAKASGE